MLVYLISTATSHHCAINWSKRIRVRWNVAWIWRRVFAFSGKIYRECIPFKRLKFFWMMRWIAAAIPLAFAVGVTQKWKNLNSMDMHHKSIITVVKTNYFLFRPILCIATRIVILYYFIPLIIQELKTFLNREILIIEREKSYA